MLIKDLVRGTIVEDVARKILRRPKVNFSNSWSYWETRYRKNGTSGAGSYGQLARFKTKVINSFCNDKSISKVIEFGCGDGNQLELACYKQYVGFDVSQKSVDLCRKRFCDDDTKEFYLLSEYSDQTAELTLSLDVIYHLIEDEVFYDHMHSLFNSAEKYVVIYASNFEDSDGTLSAAHVRHRKFSDWIDSHRSDFGLLQHIRNEHPFAADNPENTSFADFYIYERK